MLDSILCPLCDHAVETTQHVLFQCPIVRSVFHIICNWWELEGQDLESFSEWQNWFLSIRMSAGTKNLLGLQGLHSGLRESVIHLSILTDSIILILVLSSLANVRGPPIGSFFRTSF
ncbi:hypothetical protein Tco_0747089 [Tanacetum coccineum]